MQDFKKLKVWQKSHELALRVYQHTSGLPKSELYGLTSQIRRATTSIPANIAEGCGRDSKADMARFLQITGGSACEVECFLLLARDLSLLQGSTREELLQNVAEVRRMLSSLVSKLKT